MSEIDDALNYFMQQTLDAAYELQAMGIEMEKAWDRPVDRTSCRLCAKNVLVGWIPLDQAFPSGHQRPLAHGGCHCDLLIHRKPIR